MVDVDTFLTTLYVMVDDFCKTCSPCETQPGPQAQRSRSAVLTLAIFGQWQLFGSERGFSRYAQRHLRAAFPQLPPPGAVQPPSAAAACGAGRLFAAPRLAVGRPAEGLGSARQSWGPHPRCQATRGRLVAGPNRYWLEPPPALVCRVPSADSRHAGWGDDRFGLWASEHQRASVGRDLLGPAPLAAARAAACGSPRAGPLCGR